MIKPTVILILLFTVAGSIFLKRYPRTTVKYTTSEGYHTFIMASFAGIVLYSVAYILVTAFTLVWPVGAFYIGSLFKSFVSVLMPSVSDEVLNLASVSIIAFLLARFIPRWQIKRELKKGKDPFVDAWIDDAYGDKTPEFTSLAFKSSRLGLPIAFTLSNKKVYIGFPLEFGMVCNDIHVLPLISGYRCEDKLDLHYVIDYKPVIQKIHEQEYGDMSPREGAKLVAEKFSIVIPHREIVHANLHDMEYRDHFNETRFDRDEVKASNVHFETDITKSKTTFGSRAYTYLKSWFK
ncbi:hypothetical protein [Pseudoalteromonas obscura]|uniref:Uncharacterized protein n=1 Tax=Pseudoalteromonas obscura TaxID=3048491 RepID=A0ABT7ESA8_9GAMM|nr:hypothetical protein [Pseudoalteromonas sp. P94(2023)]MDK2597934.1 hypothetical protein [Pseudoalteromonas sp. P94(2023)]